MSYEYIAYIVLSLLTLVFAVNDYRKASFKRDFLVFVVLVVLSLVVRANPHSDMLVYIESMRVGFREMLSTPYYLKNILFWGTNSLFYAAGISPYVILFVWDVVSFVLMIRIRKNIGLPYYFIPLFYVSFIGVFDLQNIYRQYIASVFLLYILSASYSKQWKFFALLMVAALIHSGSLMFVGTVWIASQQKKVPGYLYSLMLAVMVVLSPKLFATDYLENTGSNSNILYLLTIILSASFCIYTWRMLGNRIDFRKDILTIFYLLVIAVTAYWVQGTSLYYERIGLFILPLMMMYSVKYINYYRQRCILNAILSLVLILPTFTFTATRLMLTNVDILLE